MHPLLEKCRARLRETDYRGETVLIRVYPGNEFDKILDNLANSENADIAMAEFISTNILDREQNIIFPVDILIGEGDDKVSNAEVTELAELIRDVNLGKKKGNPVQLRTSNTSA